MSDTFITSDEHYGHRGIITNCHRPFSSVDHMREEIVARHNKKVPNNTNYLTIHVGDMFWETMSEAEAMVTLGRLNGRHAFIWGNHDKTVKNGKDLQRMFAWIAHAHTLHFNKHKLTIYHYAQRVWDKSHQGAWHVYGHSHGGLPGIGHSFDIGVDCHNFEPWSLEEIEAKMAKTIIPPDKVWVKDDEGQRGSMAQQRTCNAPSGGSIPSAGSSFIRDYVKEFTERWKVNYAAALAERFR